MAKFNNLEQVKKEFLLRSQGGDKLGLHSTRFSDIEKYAEKRMRDTITGRNAFSVEGYRWEQWSDENENYFEDSHRGFFV